MNKLENCVPFILGIAGIWLGGYLVGRSHQPKERSEKIEPGTYLDCDKTSSVLMTVGMQALADGLYDEYELDDILSKSEI